jgi:hypothetical protein
VLKIRQSAYLMNGNRQVAFFLYFTPSNPLL